MLKSHLIIILFLSKFNSYLIFNSEKVISNQITIKSILMEVFNVLTSNFVGR